MNKRKRINFDFSKMRPDQEKFLKFSNFDYKNIYTFEAAVKYKIEEDVKNIKINEYFPVAPRFVTKKNYSGLHLGIYIMRVS